MESTNNYTKTQLSSLVALRVCIGWYFLYEGLAKFFTNGWTAYGYLMDSEGWFAPIFSFIAENSSLMGIADTLTIYGLILVGLSLMLGCFSRLGAWGATLFLMLFYFSHPPMLDSTYLLPTEGSYLWIDKNMVMLVASIVTLVFPTSKKIGFDRFIYKFIK